MWQFLCVMALLIAVVVLVALIPRCKTKGRCGKRSGCNGRHRQRRPPPVGRIPCEHVEVEDVPESHGTTTLCLSCIDYRFAAAIPEVLEDEENVHYYDPFSLAGGSLGYNQTLFPSWPQTWLDTVGLAKTLHKITQIIIIEHQDCGMYTAVYGPLTPAQEYQLQVQNMKTFQTAMATAEPTLAVRGYLVYLNGSLERLI